MSNLEQPKKIPVWIRLFQLKKTPVIFCTIIFYVIAEAIVIFVAPLFIPKTVYLSWYLSDIAQEKTKLFFENKNSLIPDENTGWKNRPNMIRGNWVIDSLGSRATHAFSFNRTKPIRVLFLGSSMINGGSRIKNSETISAGLEDEKIETLNFATMMYSMDQVYLDYTNRLYKYDPDVIIVGIDVEPGAGLKNHYIPFRFPEEENMPYLKPRFELKGDGIELINVSPEDMLAAINGNPELIHFLSENDGFYYRFEMDCRMGVLPLSGMFKYLSLKSIRFKRYFIEDTSGNLILIRIMDQLIKEADKNGADVIFLMNTDQTIFEGSGVHKYLNDIYGNQLALLKSKGFQVVDIREIFRKSGKPGRKLFAKDRSHYSVLGNKFIAEALRPIVYNQINSKKIAE